MNIRNYDNRILYTRMLGCDNEQIYQQSKCYRDIYDFASTGNKKSLKKLEFKRLLNSLYGIGAIGADFDGDVVSRSPIDIKNVIFNDPATIVFWSDGTKTVVKCRPGDKFDPEKGLAMAITKKTMGNTGSYCNVFKKWIKEEKSDGEV